MGEVPVTMTLYKTVHYYYMLLLVARYSPFSTFKFSLYRGHSMFLSIQFRYGIRVFGDLFLWPYRKSSKTPRRR